jgi:hypothetical protein
MKIVKTFIKRWGWFFIYTIHTYALCMHYTGISDNLNQGLHIFAGPNITTLQLYNITTHTKHQTDWFEDKIRYLNLVGSGNGETWNSEFIT